MKTKNSMGNGIGIVEKRRFVVLVGVFSGILILLSAGVGNAASIVTVNPGESIQDAIDSLPPGGGIIELAAGTHYISQGGTIDITIHANQGGQDYAWEKVGSGHYIGVCTFPYGILLNKKNNIIIRGAGKDNTILISEGTDFPDYDMVLIVGSSDITIEDLTIKSNTEGSQIPQDAGTAVNIIGKSKNVHISNVKTLDLYGIVSNGRWPKDGLRVMIHVLKEYHLNSNFIIEDCSIIHNKKSLHFTRLYNSIIRNNNIARSGGYGVDLNANCQSNTIENNVVFDCANAGIKTYAGNTGHVIRDNTCYECKEGIAVMTGAKHIDVINNDCINNDKGGIRLSANYLQIDHINVRNNRVYNNNGFGIGIIHYKPARSDCNPPYDITIESNTIYGNSGDGIHQDINLYDLVVTNNIITNNGGYGINHINDESQLIISYNDVLDNTNGDYHRVSKGTGDKSVVPLFASTTPGKEDFHLKSTSGRWRGSEWLKDAVTSLCVDGGDPLVDLLNEPAPNGAKINMGAYGNTDKASKSASTGPDTRPPYTTGHSPAKSAIGVAKDTDVVVQVKDDGEGVDKASIVMTVEGVQVTPTITGTPGGYTLTYNPLTDFEYGQVVNVTVHAHDLAS